MAKHFRTVLLAFTDDSVTISQSGFVDPTIVKNTYVIHDTDDGTIRIDASIDDKAPSLFPFVDALCEALGNRDILGRYEVPALRDALEAALTGTLDEQKLDAIPVVDNYYIVDDPYKDANDAD